MTIEGNKNFTTSVEPIDYDPFEIELETVVPTTAMQMEIWLSTQMGDDASCAYNESCKLYFKGPLDRKALRAAVQDVVQRHQSLRAIFSSNGEHMCIAKAVIVDLPEDQLPDDERFEEVLKNAVETEVSIAFDLYNGPLLRVRLMRKNDQEHYLLLTAHHVICDGWSLEVIINDLGEFYSAHANGQACRLDAPPQYGEYAIASRSDLEKEKQRKAREYWLKVLSGQIPTLDLPLDKPRPKHRSFPSARVDHTVPPDLVKRLQHFGANRHASLFVVLLTAFQVLLYRLTNQTDIITGVSYAGHLQPGLSHLVGHCVSLLPIRSRLKRAASFNDILEQLRQRMLDAHVHNKCSYGSLIPELNITRQSNRLPVVSVIFGFYKMDGRIAQNFNLLQSQFSINPRTNENFELFVSTIEIQGKVVFETQYNTDLFDRETIVRWLKCFETLLEAAIEQADKPIAELPLLDALSIRQLIYDWNNTQKPNPKGICLHQLFEEQVRKTPENVAVVFEGETLSYKELNAKANQVAHYLRKHGVEPDVLVGVLMERCFEMIIGLLGILKAGGAYVPIDPLYPKDRILFMLKDSQVPVLLTQHRLMESLPDYKGHFICLDTGWAGVAQESRQNPKNKNNTTDLSYVIYTSGSTGTPKGVMVEHGNVPRLFSATEPWFHFDADDVWTLFHSFAFDFSVWEIWGALLHGGRLIIVPLIVSRSPDEFYQLLCREKVTILNQTPSAFRQLVNAQTETMESHALRKIIFGGEALEMRYLKPWYERNGTQQTQLINMYGITETTVHVTYRALTPADTDHSGASPIGSRIPDLRIYILNAHRQPVPVGVTGELYVGGAGVARGYLNRPELTAERFLPDPFARTDEPDARIYKTGDLGRWLSDGSIEYVGRNDLQIKIRGFRIEIGEIEATLLSHDKIKDAAVDMREYATMGKRLLAYVVLIPEATLSPNEIRDYVSAKLPQYMIPASFIFLEEIPLTPNGKINRKVLPEPNNVYHEIEGTYVAPCTPTEEMVANIWAQVLGLQKIGTRDNFFELGGHSLLAVNVMTRLSDALHLEMSLRDFFEAPTVAELALIIIQKQAHGIDPDELERLFKELEETNTDTQPDGNWLLGEENE